MTNFGYPSYTNEIGSTFCVIHIVSYSRSDAEFHTKFLHDIKCHTGSETKCHTHAGVPSKNKSSCTITLLSYEPFSVFLGYRGGKSNFFNNSKWALHYGLEFSVFEILNFPL